MADSRAITGPALRLAAFYAAVGGLLYLLGRWLPQLRAALAPDAAQAPALEQMPAVLQEGGSTIVPTWSAVLIALVGAMVFALPVAWTYAVTKRDEGYETSVVQMIVLLPVAVAAVVLVVFGKLSLAFALAGIVAAVRFRTTLKDVKDGVFAFVAIGIGLATGIQSLFLAAMLSLVFSALALTLWKLRVGEETAGPPAHASLGEALVPGSSGAGVRVGDGVLHAPLSEGEWRAIAPQRERLAMEVRADAERVKGKYRYALVIHTTDADRGRAAVEPVLERESSRWTPVDTVPSREGTVALLYFARAKKDADLDDLARRLHQSDGAIRAVEVRPLKELRKRLG